MANNVKNATLPEYRRLQQSDLSWFPIYGPSAIVPGQTLTVLEFNIEYQVHTGRYQCFTISDVTYLNSLVDMEEVRILTIQRIYIEKY